MLHLILLVGLIASSQGLIKGDGKCANYQANFNLKNLIGSWHVVAIVPETAFPKNHSVSCYVVEFSETDAGGLKWLVNQTINSRIKSIVLNKIDGQIIRQRYHSKQPFDVWSKAIEGVNGCFEQVLSLNHSDKRNISKAITQTANMQLHLLKTNDGRTPLLLQLLWSKMITGVIYSRTKEVSVIQLADVIQLMTKLRGPQREPKLCDELVTEKLGRYVH